MDLKDIVKKLAQIFEEQKISYLITGGVAVTIWGAPRYTADVDLVVEIAERDKIQQLAEALKRAFPKAYIDTCQALDAWERKSEFNVIESVSGVKIDFWLAKGEFDKARIKRAWAKNIKGKMVKFISPEDLIISKLIWSKKAGGSWRQIDDVKSVLAVQGKELDFDYLKLWIGKLGLEGEWVKLDMKKPWPQS